MLDELNIALGIIMAILVADSWYNHYIVRDGIARVILLWFNGVLFALFTLRTFGYILVEMGVLNIVTSRTWNQWVFIILYSIPVLQQWLQRVTMNGHEEKDCKETKTKRERK